MYEEGENGMKKGFIVTAAVFMGIGMVLFGGALMAAGFDFSKFCTDSFETHTYTANADFQTIDFRSLTADIRFLPAKDDVCKVVCSESKQMKQLVSVDQGVLTVRTEDKRKWYDHIGIFLKTPQIAVYLPAEQYESCQIENRTGTVSIPDSFSFGNVIITCSTGDVICKASVKEMLKIKTATGDIRLENLHAGEIHLSVSTGDISADSVDCEKAVSIESSTGDITLKKTVAKGDFGIQTTTGDVWFDRCDAGRIKVKTSTGDVSGTLCTEKVFLTDTSTGSVRVPKTASGGVCEIKTSTGDIELWLSNH